MKKLSTEKLDDMVREEYRRRMRACIKLGVPTQDITLERVRAELAANPELYSENWREPEAYVPQQRYTQYVTPIADAPVKNPARDGLCIKCGKARGKSGTTSRCRPCANKVNAVRNRSRV